MTDPTALLRRRLASLGVTDVVGIDPAPGGLAATAGIARRGGGQEIFVKAFDDPPSGDVFAAEAEGLEALRTLGAVATPEVVAVGSDLLALSTLHPRPQTSAFWEELATTLHRMHAVTHDRFGWHRDNWLGRRRQDNTWEDDGFAFFAEHRLLRWLEEPPVQAALDAADRAALEHLCTRLPELLPVRPASLTHGDLWMGNLMATADGRPALIDPAVSYMWAEVDVAHLWITSPPPESAVFFEVYAELSGWDSGWRERMPLVQLRQHLAVIAQYADEWGSVDIVRETLAPFRRRRSAGARDEAGNPAHEAERTEQGDEAHETGREGE